MVTEEDVCVYATARINEFLAGKILDTNPVMMDDEARWEYCVKNKVSFVAVCRTTRFPFLEMHEYNKNKVVSTLFMADELVKLGWATEVYKGAYQITSKGKLEATEENLDSMQPSSEEISKKLQARPKLPGGNHPDRDWRK